MMMIFNSNLARSNLSGNTFEKLEISESYDNTKRCYKSNRNKDMS